MVSSGGSIRSWKKRWFLLQNYTLKYFEVTDKKLGMKGEIILNDQYTAKDGLVKTGRPHSFELYHPTLRSYYFVCQSQHEKEVWIKELNCYISQIKKEGKKKNSLYFK